MPAKKPADLHSLFQKSFNTRDTETLVSLYEKDAVLMANGEPFAGHDAIRSAILGFLSLHGILSLETISVIESRDLAVLHSKWMITPPSGPALHGLSTEVARRQPDGRWLFAIDNPNTPAC